MKGTCLAIYSRCVNAELAIEEALKTSFPWCAVWSADPEPTSHHALGFSAVRDLDPKTFGFIERMVA